MATGEQDNYHKNLKVYRDLMNSFDTADREGFKRGVERGLKQGIEEGLEKGIKKSKIEIAKNLLDILDNELIASKTGLTLEEIEKLR